MRIQGDNFGKEIIFKSQLHDKKYTYPRHIHQFAELIFVLEGSITVTIDGESFDLPAGFFGLGAAKREIFRLGDEQAVLVVDKKGSAQLLFQGATVPPDGGTEDDV